MRRIVFVLSTLFMVTSLPTLPNLSSHTRSFLSGNPRPDATTSLNLPPQVRENLTAASLPTRQSRHFGMLPPGTTLPNDAECAAAIRPTPEHLPANQPYNATRGNQKLANDFFTGGDPRANTLIASRVTGNFAGTTDEIIQWVACKWGIDEQVVRAQVMKESSWYQGRLGDWQSNPDRCPPGQSPSLQGRSNQCPQSWGAMQVKYRFFRSAWPGSATSTAFNLDTAYAVWRACYEGYETWLNHKERGSEYAAGDAWGCIGRWFAGSWYTKPANEYIQRVQAILADRRWERPGHLRP